tara:strand:- start:3217 stop:4086 length:870 start_codon:yes stop_codon:yes gene_type:complete
MERDARFLVDLHRDRSSINRELGQHYLFDTSVLQSAIDMAGELDSKKVIEIGCGPGTLTHHLLSTGAIVYAVELYPDSIDHMNRHFADEIDGQMLHLIEGDALTVPLPKGIDAIVANIPYQISSPLLERIQREYRDIPAVLLVQEEFAERMAMETPPLDMGPLGLSLWLDFDIEIGRRVPPNCFSPQPRINSRLVKLNPTNRLLTLESEVDRRLFRQLTSHCFKDRRRKLRNLLKRPPRRLNRIPGWHKQRWEDAIGSLRDEEIMEERPDMLDPEDWLNICEQISMFES